MSSDAVALMTAGLGILVFLTSACRPSTAVARVGASVTVLATVIIYLIWRYGRLGDMPAGGSAEAVWMWSFLLVETACLLSFALLAVLLSRSLERQRTQQPDSGEARLRSLEAAELPRVDVWIATYNEEWAILEKTIIGALAIDWPPELLRIWVLDDGRRDWLRDECAGMGVGYLTRPDNAGRKAGNHNNALATTGAPFILSVDADFVVYPNILYRTLGLFDDPEVAIVQTPQAYFNIDPTRRALDLGQRSPHGYDGIDMFYRTLQPARDAWRSAFYCGTSAVLRRTALEDIGGFVTITDIEDQATSVKLLSCGWRVAFLNEVLSNGLAAESGAAYHDQRNRWCRGSLQICYTSFGPFGHGLRPMQRMLFLQEDWVLGSICPIVFCLAPGVVWLSEWRVSPANWRVGGVGHAAAPVSEHRHLLELGHQAALAATDIASSPTLHGRAPAADGTDNACEALRAVAHQNLTRHRQGERRNERRPQPADRGRAWRYVCLSFRRDDLAYDERSAARDARTGDWRFAVLDSTQSDRAGNCDPRLWRANTGQP